MSDEIIQLDGSFGEGGGQILRSALSLSLLTGTPFQIANIRAKRERPGLLRQHLTAVEATAKIGGAEVRGAAVNSCELFFAPKKISGGEYVFKIGTAGSAALVLQTILLPLLRADGASKVHLEGGTHNPWAPPFDFIERAFLPLLRKMGARVSARLVRPGFYPAGGGCIEVEIEPVEKLVPLEIPERGKILRKCGVARVAGLARSIAVREIEVLESKLTWEEGSSLRPEVLDEKFGPGNVIVVDVESEHITEVFTGFGERGVSAENVAEKVVDEVRDYIAAEAPVGTHLADQLLLPLALSGGGKFTTMSPSKHLTTNIEVLKKFIAVNVNCSQHGAQLWQVSIL